MKLLMEIPINRRYVSYFVEHICKDLSTEPIEMFNVRQYSHDDAYRHVISYVGIV